MSKIKFKDVFYKYQSQIEDETNINNETPYALSNINLEIDQGEFVCLLGKNGSGKSTLARLVNGLNLPTSGVVYVDNFSTKDESKIYEIRKKAGIVFQNPDDQIVSSIVEEDIAFGPENLNLPSSEIEERIDTALDSVSMMDYKFSDPSHLSGGQKQKIAIASQLALRQEIIVFDEPMSMLDEKDRKDLLSVILKLNKKDKITIVLITHNAEEAIYSDRIIALKKGSIEYDGPTKEFFADIENPKSLGIEIPVVNKIAHKLSKKIEGFNTNILTKEDLVKEILKYKK
jgi:energy-coupling factor transport system ATP-binding protein